MRGATARSPRRTVAIPWLAACLAMTTAASAQVGGREPRLGFAYPAGGRVDSTFEVTVGGRFLQGASAALVTGGGVQATVLEHVRPLSGSEQGALREQIKALADRKAAALRSGRRGARGAAKQPPRAPAGAGWTEADEKQVAELRARLAESMRLQANPAISERVRLRVATTPDAEPGDREIRLRAAAGLTNPIVFQVGRLPEVLEREPGAAPPRQAGAEPPPMAVSVPAVVNGQILPGDVDRFRFPARKGDRLVAAIAARRLMPYLADAVPGWFQATLAVHDAEGRELAYSDDYRFDPDPVLFLEVPADGEYVVEVKDAVYRGREDFVYRLALGPSPFVTSVFPLGGRAGTRTTVEVRGWNLPATAVDVDPSPDLAGAAPGCLPIILTRGGLLSNEAIFAVDALPECREAHPEATEPSPMAVTPPVIVNGRIDPPGDFDDLRLEARAGAELVAEVRARRLGSPLDSVLEVRDAGGRLIAESDDREDKGAGLLTHQADSWLRIAIPADGSYTVRVRDAQAKGGPEHAYRLRLGPPRPDFELRVVPSTINVRAGAAAPVTVHAVRRDGFAGDILLALEDAPPGLVLDGGRVPAGEDSVRVTIQAPASPPAGPFALRIEGRAAIGGSEVRRPAVPADEMMQAFAYRHLVPARALEVLVTGSARPRNVARVLSETPVRIPAGATCRVRVGAPAARLLDAMDFELSDPPEGIRIRDAIRAPDGVDIVIETDGSRVRPGLEGNLIVNATARRGGPKPKPKAPASQRPAPTSTLPAIPFVVVAP